MTEQTDLFQKHRKLLHVSPKYALARRLVKMPHLSYQAIDLEWRPYTSARMDVSALGFPSNTFDAIICIHVLEHVTNDRRAMEEMFRVLKPGGWAFISVPLQLDAATHEDPSIVDPEERRLAFGEKQHVRLYGRDLTKRLETAGFRVRLDLASGVDLESREKYGLLDDENIFHCWKV